MDLENGQNLRAAQDVCIDAGVSLLVACGSDDTTTEGGGGQDQVGSSGSGGQGQGQGASSGDGGKSGSSGTAGKPSSSCVDCAGCCDGSTCLPLASQNSLSCGKGGAQCSTCGEGKTCSAGACVVDPSICSPLNCSGCCDGNTCVTERLWTSCSKGGTTCQTCEPMALCTLQYTCDSNEWGPDAIIDLYIEEYSVSASQCSDVGSPPDPTITFTVLDKTYTGTCDDQYTCTFKPAWKIPNIKLGQFQLGLVKFSITDVDESFDDPCWGATMPASPPRDTKSRVLKPGDGTLTYHLRPAGY